MFSFILPCVIPTNISERFTRVFDRGLRLRVAADDRKMKDLRIGNDSTQKEKQNKTKKLNLQNKAIKGANRA